MGFELVLHGGFLIEKFNGQILYLLILFSQPKTFFRVGSLEAPFAK
jgi:hypothetical protein